MNIQKHTTACGGNIIIPATAQKKLRESPSVLVHLDAAISKIVLPLLPTKIECEVKVGHVLGFDSNEHSATPDRSKLGQVSSGSPTLTVVAQPTSMAGQYELITAYINAVCHEGIAWHYTTGTKFDLIVNSGVLLPADIGVFDPELPILWFSKHPIYEPTAIKNIRHSVSSVYNRPALYEVYKAGKGLVRFGCPLNKLKCGQHLRKAANMEASIWRRLNQLGERWGANPHDWWGHVGAMLVDEVSIEIMDENMTWCPLNG